MATQKKETLTETKKKTMRDLTNFQLLKILERFGVKYSVKLDDVDNSKYMVFVRKENVTDEMHLIALKRFNFNSGKDAYVKALKKGLTPYEYMIEQSEQFKLDNPNYVSKKDRLLTNTETDVDTVEIENTDTDDILF